MGVVHSLNSCWNLSHNRSSRSIMHMNSLRDLSHNSWHSLHSSNSLRDVADNGSSWVGNFSDNRYDARVVNSNSRGINRNGNRSLRTIILDISLEAVELVSRVGDSPEPTVRLEHRVGTSHNISVPALLPCLG